MADNDDQPPDNRDAWFRIREATQALPWVPILFPMMARFRLNLPLLLNFGSELLTIIVSLNIYLLAHGWVLLCFLVQKARSFCFIGLRASFLGFVWLIHWVLFGTVVLGFVAAGGIVPYFLVINVLHFFPLGFMVPIRWVGGILPNAPITILAWDQVKTQFKTHLSGYGKLGKDLLLFLSFKLPCLYLSLPKMLFYVGPTVTRNAFRKVWTAVVTDNWIHKVRVATAKCHVWNEECYETAYRPLFLIILVYTSIVVMTVLGEYLIRPHRHQLRFSSELGLKLIFPLLMFIVWFVWPGEVDNDYPVVALAMLLCVIYPLAPSLGVLLFACYIGGMIARDIHNQLVTPDQSQDLVCSVETTCAPVTWDILSTGPLASAVE